MKKFFFFSLIALCIHTICLAQFTLVHTYSGQVLYPACFSTGSKYVVADQIGSPSEITIYNLDHTVFKLISIPSQAPAIFWAVVCLADNLFDNDSTTFEYLLNVIVDGGTLKIYEEDGTLLFSKDSTTSFGITGSPAYHEFAYVVFQNDSGAFISVLQHNGDSVNLYKLPGKISYCNSCCTAGAMNPVAPVNGNHNLMQIGNPVPNPSQHSTTITYQLPYGISKAFMVFYNLEGVEVKRFQIGSAFHDIQISTSNLVPGTYLYEIQTTDGNSDGKKMIVIE